jgi:hypothetical protein
MRQSEARDLRSFLAEPVEEFVEVADKGKRSWDGNMAWDSMGTSSKDTNPFLQNSDHSDQEEQLQEVGVQFITPWRGTEEQLPGTGVRFAMPWEGTGGQLHEVGTRFTSPLTLEDDLALQQTLPMLRLRPAGKQRATADLAPAPHKIVPGASWSALQSWERKRRTIYTWLILLTLFLLVILGGIGLDSLIASYR